MTQAATEFAYFLVESAFIVRVPPDYNSAERLFRDGSWKDYPDLQDVSENGRHIEPDEVDAIAKELFAMHPDLP
jgi:hypothetical protein